MQANSVLNTQFNSVWFIIDIMASQAITYWQIVQSFLAGSNESQSKIFEVSNHWFTDSLTFVDSMCTDVVDG